MTWNWKPYILHMRLRAFPVMAAHFSVGFLLAVKFDFTPGVLWRWLAGVILWAGFGHSGTLALNSAIDKDTGDIGYLFNPPPVPRYLWLFALILLVLGDIGAYLLSPSFFIVYTVCFVMAVFYSVPPIRLKAIAGADVVNNALGYGAITLYGGWAVLDLPVPAMLWLVLAAFFFLFAGFYPLTQFYQFDEDRERGDRTLVIALGKRGALIWSIVTVLIAFLFLAAAIFIYHFTPWSLLVAAAFVAWAAVLLPWLKNIDTYPEQRGMYRALWAWALTDIAVIPALVF